MDSLERKTSKSLLLGSQDRQKSDTKVTLMSFNKVL